MLFNLMCKWKDALILIIVFRLQMERNKRKNKQKFHEIFPCIRSSFIITTHPWMHLLSEILCDNFNWIFLNLAKRRESKVRTTQFQHSNYTFIWFNFPIKNIILSMLSIRICGVDNATIRHTYTQTWGHTVWKLQILRWVEKRLNHIDI